MQDQGLLTKWKERYWPKQDKCMSPDQAQPMTLSDIQGPVYIMFGLLALAGTVLIMEIVWYQWNRAPITFTLTECFRNLKEKVADVKNTNSGNEI